MNKLLRSQHRPNLYLFGLIVAYLCCLSSCDLFFFTKVLICDDTNNSSRCQKWLDNTTMSYFSSFGTFCFSGQTYIRTRNGPVQMQHVKVGDEIFGINSQSGNSQYSKVRTWLHRDIQGLIEYERIETSNQNLTYLASEYHNIAYYDKDGKIDFKFAQKLSQGDQLVSFGSRVPLTVSSSTERVQKQGLFSPMTEFSNFYIYPENFNSSSTNNTQEIEMILVHCLSQVKDPLSNQKLAQKVISFTGILGLNDQPKEPIYSHALVSHLNFLYGSNWIQHQSLIKYQANHDTTYFASSSAQRQQQQLGNKAVTIGTLMMVETILY